MIIRDPFKKWRIRLDTFLLPIKNSVSSLPKWYEATTKNKIRDTVGKNNQNIMIPIPIREYII